MIFPWLKNYRQLVTYLNKYQRLPVYHLSDLSANYLRSDGW